MKSTHSLLTRVAVCLVVGLALASVVDYYRTVDWKNHAWQDPSTTDIIGIGPKRFREVISMMPPKAVWSLDISRRLSRGKAGRRYEARVVKAPDWFFCVLGLVFALAGVSEERASSCLTQKTVTAECEAKIAQERNGINGRGPRSGKQPVYAGFDLEQS
jgi:hypothetical protein